MSRIPGYGKEGTVQFFLVDVCSIRSEVPESAFDQTELDKLADLISATGCLLRPLILKQTGPLNFEVICGHFEYYAAVRVQRKNKRIGEMVSAFVVRREVEIAAIEQANYGGK